MHLIAYGSLMIPEVMRALLDKDFKSENITIPGYSRFSLRERIYPGITPAFEESVEGQIYFDLTTADMAVIDRFEDEIYQRIAITVETATRGQVDAEIYIIPEKYRETLATESWSVENFTENHLADYLVLCTRFRNWLQSAANSSY